MSDKSMVLPYAGENATRKKPFTHDMEVAAILCLAEAERKKPGILDVYPERISFISKLYYPIWAIPWENESLVADGLGLFSHTITYMKTPDLKDFTEAIKKNTWIRKHYRSALEKHAQTFKDFIGTAKIPVEAVISDKKILTTLLTYLRQSLVPKKKVTELIRLLPPKVNENAALRLAIKIKECWRQIQSDLKGLQYAIDVVNEETHFHEHKILREIKEARETYKKEISRAGLLIGEEVERLVKERDSKINREIKATEREVGANLKKKDMEEKKLRRLERRKSQFERKRDTRKRRGDKSGESYWNNELKRCKNEISEIKKVIQTLSERIKESRKQNEITIKKLNKDYQVMIDRENRRIADLESSRDYEITMKLEEIEELSTKTSDIINHVEHLIEEKRLQASRLKGVTIPLKLEEVTLICVPFYFVQYENDGECRNYFYAPSIAKGYEGLIRSIQKTIRSFSLEYRIKLLLHPRCNILKKMFTSVLAQKMGEDKTLKENVEGLGSSNNILVKPSFRDVLARGMEKLEREGWISSEESEAILFAYAHR